MVDEFIDLFDAEVCGAYGEENEHETDVVSKAGVEVGSHDVNLQRDYGNHHKLRLRSLQVCQSNHM